MLWRNKDVYLGETPARSSVTLCQIWVPDPQGKGRFGEPPAKTCYCKWLAATWRMQTRSWADLRSDSAFREITVQFVVYS